jgi:hypothetical protein
MPALVAGFGAGVLHVVPFTKALTCCLVVPLASVAAIMLEQKSNNIRGDIELNRGIILGLLTGIFAAFFGSFFDIFITFVTRNNEILTAFGDLTELVENFPVPENVKDESLKLMNSVARSIRETGFSAIYSFTVIFNNLIVDSIFGVIGGIIGTKVINARNVKGN